MRLSQPTASSDFVLLLFTVVICSPNSGDVIC